MDRVPVAGVIGVHFKTEDDLFLIADALGSLGRGFGSGQGGQQHRRQNCDNRDNDQQLN
jgi:hypothetical protein